MAAFQTAVWLCGGGVNRNEQAIIAASLGCDHCASGIMTYVNMVCKPAFVYTVVTAILIKLECPLLEQG